MATTALAFAISLPLASYAAEQDSTDVTKPVESIATPETNAEPAPSTEATTPAPAPTDGTAAAPVEATPTAASVEATTHENPIITSQESDAMLADGIIGLTVRDLAGKKIGKVDDLILDNDGRLTGFVVAMGGFIGIGVKKVGLRADMATIDLEHELVIARVDEETINSAPDFQTHEAQAQEKVDVEARARLEEETRQQRAEPAQPMTTESN